MNLRGLATGIGSLPFKDTQEALDLILRCCPQIPFWPQLPRRDLKEGMVAQFSEGLPYLKVSQDGISFSAHQAPDRELELFYERIIANDTDYFAISESFAAGLHAFYHRLETQDLSKVVAIKCQVTGPFTFAASIKDEGGAMLLHDPVFMQVIMKGLLMKALWQVKLFEKFAKPIIMFIDEPYLGCFGSAYTPINREDVVAALKEFTQAIKKDNVFVGVHCCGNTDWSIFTDVPGIDIINFDAFDYQDKFVLYADALKGYLSRGGYICWGIVPTQNYSGKETPQDLSAKLTQGIDALLRKGLDKGQVLKQLLISPACGLGVIQPQTAKAILGLLAETASLLRQNP